jgi:small subunit ribosomal protein S21
VAHRGYNGGAQAQEDQRGNRVLFEPFVTAGKPCGLGLGLALARQTVLSHGGSMGLAAGKGAHFVISLPAGSCYPETSDPYRSEVIPLAEVHLQDGESLESALKRFKRKVLQEDIIKDIKSHAFYLKPGQKKRVKSALARKRARKKRSRDPQD